MRSPRRPSAKRPEIPNPLAAPPAAIAQGAALTIPAPAHFERGTVIEFDAKRHTYRVAMNSGRTMIMSRVRNHPGDMTMLPNGTPVMVTHALGLPYILGVLPFETSAPSDDENPVSITDRPGHGGEDPTLDHNFGATSRATNEPRDVVPGDFVGVSKDGASVAALHGKVAQIRGSALAKVQAFGDNDLVQIACGIFRMVSWMGESKIVNDGGKTSFIWRGGADQLTQTGSDEEKYTLKLDLGHTGNMVNFEVTNREGQSLFKFHVNPQGRCELYAAGGFDQHSGSQDNHNHPIRFHGNVTEEIEGDQTVRVGGQVRVRHEKGFTEEVSNDHSHTVGQDQTVFINRNQSVQVGGDQSHTVTGDATDHFLKNAKVLFTGTGMFTHQMAGGAYLVDSANGAITFDPHHGRFRINSVDNDSLFLGANAISHAVKYEELERILLALLRDYNTFRAVVATHTHIGPSTSPPLAPYSVAFPFDLNPAKSHIVKVG